MENLVNIIYGCLEMESKSQQVLYNRFRGYACKIVFRYIYRYDKAMDIVTDGFVKMFLNFKQFTFREADAEMQLMAWLKKIMINCAIDELRKNNMMPEIGGIPDTVWNNVLASENADQLLLYKDLMKLIKDLPTNYRVIFNMYVIDGYSHIEIAERLNMPIGTCRSNLTRAKAILQSSIRKMEEAACSM